MQQRWMYQAEEYGSQSIIACRNNGVHNVQNACAVVSAFRKTPSVFT